MTETLEARFFVRRAPRGFVLGDAAAPYRRVVRAFVEVRVAEHGTQHEPEVTLKRVAERVGSAAE
jgi:hypothetical protein